MNTIVIIDPPEALPDHSACRQLYEAIGRFVLLWGRFEQHLDNLERMALNIAARSASEQDMMVSLGRKLELLLGLYETCPDLSPNLIPMQQLAKATTDLGEFRHKLVHANFARFKNGPAPKLFLRVVTHKRGKIKIDRFEPALADLELMATLTLDLHRTLLMPLLSDAETKQDPEILRIAQERGRSGGRDRLRPIRL